MRGRQLARSCATFEEATMTNQIASLIAKAVAAALFVAVAGSGMAFAAAGSSGGGGAPIVCKTGYVYSQAKQICVKAGAGLLDDKDLYEQGHALAKAGRYEAALAPLTAIEDQNDSMVLTMIGYSLRKSGKWEDGVAYYQRALAIDPNNVNTYEYLGEAFLSCKGRIDLAEEQLAPIETICGTRCEAYEDLAAALSGETAW